MVRNALWSKKSKYAHVLYSPGDKKKKKIVEVCILVMEVWNNVTFVSDQSSKSKASLSISIVTSCGRLMVKQREAVCSFIVKKNYLQGNSRGPRGRLLHVWKRFCSGYFGILT